MVSTIQIAHYLDTPYTYYSYFKYQALDLLAIQMEVKIMVCYLNSKVCYLNDGLKGRPFDGWTSFNHLNSGLVHDSDSQCIQVSDIKIPIVQ